MYISEAKRLNAAGARKIMETATRLAREAKLAVTIAIVDAGGHLILLERTEGGKFHTVHSATTKAVCAASNKRGTGSQGAVGQALDTAHAIGLALAAGPERWTAMEGGWPIMAGEECIGGVGVAGGNWEFDERVAGTELAAMSDITTQAGATSRVIQLGLARTGPETTAAGRPR